MTTNLSERTRAIVAETLPLMEQHRAQLEAALKRYIARQGTSAGRPDVTTGAITDLLLEHARQLDGTGGPAGIVETAQCHRALAIDGVHYACFGDALKPIMKDVLGAKATPPMIAAWGDAYWAIVRMLFAKETRLAA